MPKSDAQRRAQKKYEKSVYDIIGVVVKKGEHARIKTFAQSQGKSLNGFVVDVIKKAMNNENE